MNKIKLNNRIIGDNEPCFIIAEIGINHNGSIDIAKDLIDVAASAKADAVKFQTFKAENLLSNEICIPNNVKSLDSYIEIVKQQELPYDCYTELVKYAKSKNLFFISSPFDFEAVEILFNSRIDVFKIASHNINNIPLLRKIALTKLPVIISTGMSTLDEIGKAIWEITLDSNFQIGLLHCISSYPPKTNQINLRAMENLRVHFGYPVGFSDHSIGIDIAAMAVISGAKILEKHITLDNSMVGPDHEISANPEEFKLLVEKIRKFEIVYGDGIKEVMECEESMRKTLRLSIVASRDIEAGGELTDNNLCVKRPATGISPARYYNVLGKRALKFIPRNNVIHDVDIE